MRKLTTDDFALSAAIATIFLLGVAIGTGIGNWDNFREWIGALSGWAAVLVAGVTAYFISFSSKSCPSKPPRFPATLTRRLPRRARVRRISLCLGFAT